MSDSSSEVTTNRLMAFVSGKSFPAFIFSFLIFTLYTFSITLVPIRSDNDCWWHVKTGQYLLENGLPKTDVFSYTASDIEWHNHEWLTQMAFAAVYNMGDSNSLGGWRAVILFKGIILWACYAVAFVLAGRLSRNAWIALLVVALAVAIGRRTFYPRPPVVSNLILMIEIYLLTGISEGWFRKRWIFLLVPMIALWTNLHGAWIAGGLVLAAFAADQTWCILRDRLPRMPFAVPTVVFPWKILFILLPLCLIATFFNPYIYHLYELPARVMKDTALVSVIGELQPPDFKFVVDFELAIHGAFLLALLLRGFRVRIFEVLIYLFFLHQAVQHIRHMLLFSVMMIPLYSRLAGGFLEAASVSVREWLDRVKLPSCVGLIPAMGVLSLAVWTIGWVVINPREGGRFSMLFRGDLYPATYTQRNLQFLNGTDYIKSRYPSMVCDLIELAELEGRMFNENHYAGYVLWRLSPDKHLVFSDPRFDIFGGTIWRSERLISAGAEDSILDYDEEGNPVTSGWSQELDRWDVQWAIVKENSGLQWRLTESEGAWVRGAYWPRTDWQIWVRQTEKNQAMIDRLKANAALTGATSD